MCRVSARIGRGTPLPGDAMIHWLTMDVFDGLATLEDGSIDLVVTSPPFLALRSYLPADHPDKGKEIGSEATPAVFLDVMLKVTAELGRVLAPHGSICVELGDTYSGGDTTFRQFKDAPQDEIAAGNHLVQYGDHPMGAIRNMNNKIQGAGPGWPQSKSKVLIPELYRIALAYGFNPLTGQESPAGKWRVRNVVTWCRPNPPVGALGDKWRPATSDVVVACRSGKRFWDDLATRREATTRPQRRFSNTWGERGGDEKAIKYGDNYLSDEPTQFGNPSGAPLLDYWEIPLLDGEEPKPYGPSEKSRIHETNKGVGKKADGYKGPTENLASGLGSGLQNQAGAPLLDYWEIPPTGYAGAHYAVYPPALVEPLVKAMCPERVCRVCGEPSRRIVEDAPEYAAFRAQNGPRPSKPDAAAQGAMAKTGVSTTAKYHTLGFTDCGHDDWRPGIVLDPFAGSGTTLAVASGHGHDAIGIDLDPRNEDLARERVGPLMWETA